MNPSCAFQNHLYIDSSELIHASGRTQALRCESPHELFGRLLTAGNQFESFRGSLLPEFQQWLRELFHSRLIDGLRRHQIAEKRRQGSEVESLSLSSLTSPNDAQSVLASRREEASRILEARENLSEEHQRVIQLRYIENLTFEALAEQLNVSVATVWRRFHEAVESLHRRLHP